MRAAVILALLALSHVFASRVFLPYWIPVFLVGICYVLFILHKISFREFVVWFGILGAILFVDNRTSFYVVIVALPLIHVLRDLRIPGLVSLGEISYSLYLFHGLSVAVVVKLLSQHVSDLSMKVLIVVAGVAVALAFAQVMYLLVERPAHLLSKRIRVGAIAYESANQTGSDLSVAGAPYSERVLTGAEVDPGGCWRSLLKHWCD